MADVNISKYRASVVRDGSKPASPGFVVSEGQDPVNPPGTNNFVPYTGATANVELGEYGLESGFVTLDTTPTNTPTDQGTIYWDDTRSTAALIMNGTLQHIGQDSFFYVKNSSGSTIPKGTCVGFAGTDGGSGHLLVTPFLANGSVPSTYFMGVTSEAIANGAFGQVMHFGELTGINTSGFTAGALLYASSTVAGAFQTTAPVAPNNIILVAAAVNSKNNGAIVVRPTLGSNINSDEGVKITSPTTGDLLQLQAGGLWENKTLAQVIGSAYVPSTRTLTINGTTQDLSADRTFNVGTVTSVGLSSATSGVTIGGSPVTGVGAFTLTIATASGSQQGLLSAADWTTFNNKIGGTLATGQVAFGTAANTIGGGNNLFWDNVNGRFGVGTSTPSSRAEIAQTSTGNLDYLTIYNSGGGAVNDQTALSFEHGGNRRSNKIFSTLESSTSTALGFVTTASTVEAERWRITSTGILQSNGAQTIQTSTGNLTLATAAGNGNIILSPNGTGGVGINTNTPLGTLDIRVAGNGGSASNASNSIIISPLSISEITEGEIGSQIILNARRNGVSDGVSIASVMQTANFDLASMAFYTHSNISGSPRIECMRIFGASGDVLLQNGGTFTDAGFRLDVNGTARVQGNFTTNLTQGSVPFIGASGLLSQDNTNFFWDNTNKRLGVGTTTPIARLNTYQVNGGGESQIIFQNFSTTTDTTVGLYLSPTNGTLTTGSIRSAFIKGINVGGGVTALTFGTNTSGADPLERWRITSAGILQSNGAQTIQTSTGNLTLTSADNTGIVDIRRNNRALGAELRLTNSFNGIGWISGDVVGTLNFTATDESLTEPIRARIQAVSSTVGNRPANMNLAFTTANNDTLTEGFRLTNLSNLLIGTTTDSGFRLDVNGTARVTNTMRIGTINNGVGDFITTDANGVLTRRTAAQTLTDIGAQSALTNPVTGTGASGQVSYFNGTTTITSESNLFWDATNDRLGIGTSSPTDRLTLHRDGATAVYAHWRNNSNANNAYIGITGDGLMQIQNNGNIDFYTGASYNNQMTLAGTGNLIIGNPGSDNGARLQVSGTSRFSGNVGIGVAPSSDALNVTGIDYNNSAYFLGGSTIGASYGIQVRAGSNSTDYSLLVQSRSGSDYFRVRGDGAATFTGKTNISKNHSDYAFTIVNTDTNGYGMYIQAGSTYNAIDVLNAAGTSQLFMVKGNGNVLIGTTTDNGAKLQVNGDILTSAPSGGTAGKWKLGTATSGSYTIGGKIRIEINGVAYDILTT